MKLKFSNCACGSGLEKRAVFDGHNIFLTFVCDKCADEKLRGFRPDIFDEYETDEPIEAE